jgi:hypothetical protein
MELERMSAFHWQELLSRPGVVLDTEGTLRELARLEDLWQLFANLDSENACSDDREDALRRAHGETSRSAHVLRTQLDAANERFASYRAFFLKRLIADRNDVMERNQKTRNSAPVESDAVDDPVLCASQLLDIEEFDSSSSIQRVSQEVKSAMKARHDVEVLERKRIFSEEETAIREKIAKVKRRAAREQMAQVAVIARLTAKLQKAGVDMTKEAQEGTEPIDQPPEKVRRECASEAEKALSEGPRVRRWGTDYVARLGLDSYPSRPAKWSERSSLFKKPAAVARSTEEAFPFQSHRFWSECDWNVHSSHGFPADASFEPLQQAVAPERSYRR